MPSLISPITSGAIAESLNSLIHTTSGTGSGGSTEDPRSAMVFTSDLRRVVLENAAREVDRLQQKEANNALQFARLQNGTAQAFRDLQNPSSTTNIVGANVLASAKQIEDLSNQMDRAQTLPEIVMELNPNNIEFDQPKRYTRQDTQRGTVFHHFTNDKGQNNDLLTLRFAGNTGNIWRRGRDQEDRDRALQRLKVWHNLYQLTREPMLLTDGTVNVFYITYMSPLFPIPISFEGFFTSVLKFSENAKKPNSRDYSMEFIVRATSPDLNVIVPRILDFVSQEVVATPAPDSRILSQ